MKTVSQSRAVFRPRKTRGLATMRDLWHFAFWIADRTGQSVVIEGVERVRSKHLATTVPLLPGARTAGHKPPAAVYRPRKGKGIALSSDLAALAAWLQPVLDDIHRSDDGRVSLHASTQRRRLPMPRGGLLFRSELLAFTAAVGAQLGFSVEASDISGSRDTGAGFHVNRRARTASIVVRSQSRHGHGKACFAFTAEDGDTGYITVRTITYTHEVGSVVETYTASGTVQGVGPGGTFDACAEVEFESSGTAEGALISVETSDTLVPWDSVIAAAAAAVADDGAPGVEWTAEWTEDEWRAESGARNEFITLSESARGNIYGEGVAEGWNIQAPKIQIENTGDTQLEVEITFTRVSDSATEVLDPVIIQPHATSAWIDTRAADPTETWNCHITRVGMGGF